LPESKETILNETITPYKMAAVAAKSANGRARAGLKLKLCTMILKNIFACRTLQAHVNIKYNAEGFWPSEVYGILNFFGRPKKMITDLGQFANLLEKSRSFLTKQPEEYEVSLRV